MYEVILIPYYESLNENATPCIFHFGSYEDVDSFLQTVFGYGNCIQVTINKNEME